MVRNHPIKLWHNPWEAILPEGVVLQILVTAAAEAKQEIVHLINEGKLNLGQDSFGFVMFDPTRPRGITALEDLVVASISLGGVGDGFLANALAKADLHDRHGLPSSQLVDGYIHCFGDGDFVHGGSVEYKKAIGGGSGFSIAQDIKLAYMMLKSIVDATGRMMSNWIRENGKGKSGADWLNADNRAPDRYMNIFNGKRYSTPNLG